MQPGTPSSSPPVSPGDILLGKYRVERVIGAGGMGVVVQARHLDLDEHVAIKFLLPGVAPTGELAARFVREARSAVKIKSEHVARVIDVGCLETGAPYMVMEYLEGQDLSAVVRQGQLPVEDAVDYVIQACEAMAEAHSAGIVHRDLKPANLFVCRRADGSDLIKVLDFGISKVQAPDAVSGSLTKTSAMMGSPYYMSPEQARSAREVDLRADIWSLGTILYELLAGCPPFLGETLAEVVTKIVADPPPPMDTFRGDVPEGLERVLLHCLEKSKDDRYQSVGELVGALIPFAARRSRPAAERVVRITGVMEMPPSRAQPLPSAAAPLPAKTATNWAETGKPGAASTRGALLAIGLSATGLLLIGSGLFFGFRYLAGSEPESAASAETLASPAPEASEQTKVAPAKSPQEVPSAEAAAPTPAPSATPSATSTARPRSAVRPASPPPRNAPASPPTHRNPLAIDLK